LARFLNRRRPKPKKQLNGSHRKPGLCPGANKVKRCVPATIFEIGVYPALKEEAEQLDCLAVHKHIALISALVQDMNVCTGSD
jgi:hypothetical protein